MTSLTFHDEQRHFPLLPKLCLTLGVAGHRAERIADVEGFRPQIVDVVAALRAAIGRIDPLPWFRDGEARLWVMSALAEGVDSMVAEIAVDRGFALDAVFPVQPEHYVDDHGGLEAQAHFRRLSKAAERTLTLSKAPVDPSQEQAPQSALVAEALVAHSTIIVAIWDGAPALGRGGAGEVVARAIETNVPVIHIPLDHDAPVRILWSQFAPFAVSNRNTGAVASRPFDPETLDALLAEILLPPASPQERQQMATYFGSSNRSYNFRVAYPLLLAATGAKKLRATAWHKALYRPRIRDEWRRYREAGGEFCAENAEMLDLVEDAFSWANHLACHYAQHLRSGLVINFGFSALAVLVALASLVLPTMKLGLALGEIAIIVVIIANIQAGNRDAWQRRWLDYRAIAERLRPLRSLKLLGIASPPQRLLRKGAGERRWVDWYVSAIWREMGSPQGSIDLPGLRPLIANEELAGEIAYHATNTGIMHSLEKSLHRLGHGSFIATIIVCAIYPLLYLSMYEQSVAWGHFFVLLSAGLPAIGGATYALRVHGDYAGAAGRSIETGQALDRIRTAIRDDDLPLATVAALTTSAARVMLVDLDEWQLTYEQRSLAIPG